MEERYGIARKKSCGLCRMEYSRVNLVCEVPIKAIDDLRKMWSEEFTPHPRHVKECAKGKFRAFTYDRIGVCTMCAQFFRVGQQEVYRPSVESAERGEDGGGPRSANDDLDKRFWDPVKQLDADRKDQLLGTAAAEIDVPGVRVPAAPLAVDKDVAVVLLGSTCAPDRGDGAGVGRRRDRPPSSTLWIAPLVLQEAPDVAGPPLRRGLLGAVDVLLREPRLCGNQPVSNELGYSVMAGSLRWCRRLP